MALCKWHFEGEGVVIESFALKRALRWQAETPFSYFAEDSYVRTRDFAIKIENYNAILFSFRSVPLLVSYIAFIEDYVFTRLWCLANRAFYWISLSERIRHRQQIVFSLIFLRQNPILYLPISCAPACKSNQTRIDSSNVSFVVIFSILNKIVVDICDIYLTMVAPETFCISWKEK